MFDIDKKLFSSPVEISGAEYSSRLVKYCTDDAFIGVAFLKGLEKNCDSTYIFAGATNWVISLQLGSKFPTLIVVKSCIPHRLSNEVLFIGFDCQNTMRSRNLPKLGSV